MSMSASSFVSYFLCPEKCMDLSRILSRGNILIQNAKSQPYISWLWEKIWKEML